MEDEARREALEQLAQRVQAEAEKLGLYAEDIRIGRAGMPGDEETGPSGPMVLVAHFMVGELAWADRVQNPEKVETDKAFKTMVVDLEEQEFEETRRRLLEQNRLLAEEEPNE